MTAIVVEDHDMFGSLLESSVLEDSDIRCIARCLTLKEARIRILADKPNIVILDNQLPDGRGIDLFKEIRHQVPETKWLLCTANASAALLKEAVREGIRGIVLKTSSPESVAIGIDQLMRGNDFFCDSSSKLLVNSSLADERSLALTQRELEAIYLMAQGLSSKMIAQQMGLAQNTVNFHIRNLCDKLGASSYIDAVNKARQRGLI